MYQNVKSSPQVIAFAAPDEGFIRQKLLLQDHVPFSASTLWRKINQGKFPKPIQISEGITAWRVSDIKSWAKDPAGYLATSQTEAK